MQAIALLQFSTRLLDAVSESTTLTTEKHDPEFLEALLSVGKSYTLLNPEKNDSFFSSWLNKVWSAEGETQIDEAIQDFDAASERLETPEQRLELLQFQKALLDNLANSSPSSNDENAEGPKEPVNKSFTGDQLISLSVLFAESKQNPEIELVSKDLLEPIWNSKHHPRQDNTSSDLSELTNITRSEFEDLYNRIHLIPALPINPGGCLDESCFQPVSTVAIDMMYGLFTFVLTLKFPIVGVLLGGLSSGLNIGQAITGNDLEGDPLTQGERWAKLIIGVVGGALEFIGLDEGRHILGKLLNNLRNLDEAGELTEEVASATVRESLQEVYDDVRIPDGIPIDNSDLVDQYFRNIDDLVAQGTLRFEPSDLVYGPSAGGNLRRLQTTAGGRLLTDLGSPNVNESFKEFTIRIMEEQIASGGKIKFDLTFVQFRDEIFLDNRPANMPIHIYDGVTSVELRHLRDNWSRFQDRATFYYNGLEVEAPWIIR